MEVSENEMTEDEDDELTKEYEILGKRKLVLFEVLTVTAIPLCSIIPLATRPSETSEVSFAGWTDGRVVFWVSPTRMMGGVNPPMSLTELFELFAFGDWAMDAKSFELKKIVQTAFRFLQAFFTATSFPISSIPKSWHICSRVSESA